MTLRQMEYFVAVAENGSFSQAALMLNVTQPGLSQQIKHLEDEVGARLIDRLPRSAVLTEAGRVYLPEARVALQAANRASRAVSRLLSGGEGDIEIATLTSIAAGDLTRTLARWHQQYPAVALRLIEYRRNHQMENEVRDGKADLAIGPLPAHWKGPVMHLGTEEFVVVVAPDDPLIGPDPVDVVQLADRPWVLFDGDSGLSEITTLVCRAAGFAPSSTLTTAQIQTGVRFAASGLGPVLVPSSLVPPELAGCVLNLIHPYRRQLAAYSRSAFSPVTEAFIGLLDLGRPMSA
ncbi:LysR family transcriptional regulator [Kineosporia mesophila]|uniref:LysR family transcriptional regulator n=1 Tax=Kineosporia mesophila TaxID=566012 RepID=A0ABP6YZT8_9ACTN|nr:LysR family transcriptional regulator [Kineosporia mesophila]MCD5350992.1 LysR family transcriptional regulator [Kineosporia mesophila]